MRKKNQNEQNQEKELEIVTMSNGSRIEVHLRKNKFLIGKLMNEPGNITVYIPESYLEPQKILNSRKIIRTYF
jgi:hypothetical protein